MTKLWTPKHYKITETQAAIADLRQLLRGWWFTMGECSVSAHASCGPDRNGPDAHLLKCKVFDAGFDVDIAQPCDLGVALATALRIGYGARKAYLSGGEAYLERWLNEQKQEADKANTSAQG